MCRLIYNVCINLILPFVLLRLVWKGFSNPAYVDNLSDRLGLYKFKHPPRCIWVHAVSVGEVIAAVPLVKKLKSHYPEYQVLVTTMTPTGADQVKRLLPGHALHAYITYDHPWLLNAAFNRLRPRILIIMETEIWPNLIDQAVKRKIAVIYVNMRLSEKSFQGYKKAKCLFKPVLEKITAVAAQSEGDAQRLIALGAPSNRVTVTGNIKFDTVLPANALNQGNIIRKKFAKQGLVWIAASTHQGEEEQVFSAHKLILANHPDAILIIVPRHPQRFEHVYDLANSLKLKTLKQTQANKLYAENEQYQDIQVYLVDSMGQMFKHYCASDIAFVGGSLIKHGGHNILEPWLAGKPVIVGPNMFNFASITEDALKEKAIIQVYNARDLANQIINLHQSTQIISTLNNNAKKLLKRNQGGLQASFGLIKDHLN